MTLKILSPGSGLALQDAGRGGWRRHGVPGGGAMDLHAMRAANRLLGNSWDAPVLEILQQGVRLEVQQDIWIALSGGDFCPEFPAWTAHEVKAGTLIEFTAKSNGVFAYLAIAGGFHADRWFGSVSVDPRNGMGSVLRKNSVLKAESKAICPSMRPIASRILIPEARRNYKLKETFNLLPGPQFESFSEKAREQFIKTKWKVSPHSDRTGYRLEGPAIEVAESISSEPVLPGSFQITGDGKPIVTMVDGPTVGGYPKIAVLADQDRDRLAQCQSGTQLNFRWAES